MDFDLTPQQRDILASKKAKLDIRGALIGQVINAYNADGEMQQIQQFGRTEENLFLNATLEFNASHPLDYYLSLDVGEIINVAHFYSNPAELRRISQTIYSGLNEGGMATATQITEFAEKSGDADITRNFTRSYQLRDNWLETKVVGTGSATSGSVSPGSTSSIYDSNGNRKEINEINDNTPDETITRRMLFAADGTLLKKMEGKKGKLTLSDFLTGNGGFTQEAYSYHFTSNGNYLGEVAEGKKSTNLSQQFGKITSTLKNQHFSAPDLTSGTPASNYQVRSGDTLKNIALMFYGNSDYWYLIANTNGLTSDPTAPLVAGMALDIPARATQENTGTSFKPMQLEQIIGDTNPYLPYIPPPPKCNAIAMIVMIAITVVATIATAGAAAAAMGGVAGSTGIMAAGGAVMTGGAIAGTGAVVSAIGGAAAGALAAAAGGFMGSVAGQLAGKAMGVVEHFSLRNAVASGLTAGATAGMGSFLGAGQEIKAGADGAAVASKLGRFATASVDATKTTMSSLNVYGKMAMAASSVGFNVAANKLAGNNNVSFSWRNVVTSAATAGAMDYLGISDTQSSWGKATNDLGFTADVLNGVAGAAIGYGVKKGIYNEGSWNFKDVATDVFGNALGNAIVGHYVQKDRELTEYMEDQGLNPKDVNARNIVERYQKANRSGTYSSNYAEALEAMDSLFPEHNAFADPRKLNMAMLTASREPTDFGGATFIHVGTTIENGVDVDRYSFTGKLPNDVMDWTAQQNVKSVTRSVAEQARNELNASETDVMNQKATGGRTSKDDNMPLVIIGGIMHAVVEGGTKLINKVGTFIGEEVGAWQIHGFDKTKTASVGASVGRIIDNVGKFIGNEFYTWDSEGFDKTKTAWVAASAGQVIDNIGEFIDEELYTLDSTSLDKTRTYEVLKRAASSIFVDTDYFGYYSDLVKGKDPVEVVHDVVSVGTEAIVDVFVGARAAKFFGWVGSKLDVPVPIPSLVRTNGAEVLDSSLDVGRGVVPNNATVGIGKSGFTSADEFTAEAFTRYQRYTDEAYSRVLLLDKKGKLVIPEGMAKDTIVGQKVDSIARARMRAWLKSEDISEGPSELIQLNRWLRDQAGSGSYRIPDVRIPDGNLIMDGTIGLKWWDTPQIKDFYKYSGGNNITIVRPTERGGSYSILPQ